MDQAKLSRKRWKKQLKRRRLMTTRQNYLAVPGNTLSGWDDRKKKEKEQRKRRKVKQKKKHS